MVIIAEGIAVNPRNETLDGYENVRNARKSTRRDALLLACSIIFGQSR